LNTLLTRHGAVALDGAAWQPGPDMLGLPKRLSWRFRAALLIAVLSVAGIASDRWLRDATFASIPAPPEPTASLFDDPVPIAVTVSAAGRQAPWATTEEDVRQRRAMEADES